MRTHLIVPLLLATASFALTASDDQAKPQPPRGALEAPGAVSPARKISRDRSPSIDRVFRELRREVRSFDGSGNNLDNPEIGATFIHLMRLAPAAYSDGISRMAGAERPSARSVSNAVIAQDALMPNPQRLTDMFWQWGQFLDHDVDLTDGANPPEPANISVPLGDPFFDPLSSGVVEIEFNRSLYDVDTGLAALAPREQENEITAWIDASNVYGSDRDRALALRTLDGTGRLQVSVGNLLPFNTDGLANAGGGDPDLFLAGDVRANEQVGLAAMHTLFVREHNRLADRYRADDPALSGDQVYEKARAYVGALMQVITYEEFLPILLGEGALPPYKEYRADVDAGIANAFSTAAYRFGHSALSPTLRRLNADGQSIAAGDLALRDAFFRPDRLITEGGIEPVLRGLSWQICQRVDARVIDDVRNFLFGAPGSGGFDLAALNIQRGRDHGLASYNAMREAMGLPPARRFSDISSDPETVRRLRAAYDLVDHVDLWVGGLAEDPYRGGQVGRLFHRILRDQFIALRDGDRFWYERVFTGRELERLKKTRLSDVVRRNTTIGRELQYDIFHLKGEGPDRRDRRTNRPKGRAGP